MFKRGYPPRQKRLILGRSVVSRTPPPLEEFYFLFLGFNCIYAHISNLNYKNILILKKMKFRYFRVQNPLNRPISRVVIGQEVDYRSRLIYVRYCLTNTTLCL